jgi:acetyl esterase/lipase
MAEPKLPSVAPASPLYADTLAVCLAIYTYKSSLTLIYDSFPESHILWSTMHYLDPLNAAFATAISGEPSPHEMGYIKAREALESLQECEAAPDIVREALDVPGPDGTSTEVVIFRPRKTLSNLPMVFYLHGGGWIMGR